MSLSDLASLGSFVSRVAVLVSLVFLYFQLGQVRLQIGQAEKNQQASIRQARVTRGVDIILARVDPIVASEAFAAARAGEFERVTTLQYEMLYCVALSMFYHAEDSYFQHRNGLLDEDAFRTFTTATKNQMRMPLLRVMWKRACLNFDETFASFIDGIAQEVAPLQPSRTYLEEWKREVAAEVTQSA